MYMYMYACMNMYNVHVCCTYIRFLKCNYYLYCTHINEGWRWGRINDNYQKPTARWKIGLKGWKKWTSACQLFFMLNWNSRAGIFFTVIFCILRTLTWYCFDFYVIYFVFIFCMLLDNICSGTRGVVIYNYM